MIDKKLIPTFNEAAKMWDLCDAYASTIIREGWTWEGAVKYIQAHWNDEEYNIDYENDLEVIN